MAEESTPEPAFIDPEYGNLTRVWWAFWWRTGLTYLFLVFIVGRLIHLFGGAFELHIFPTPFGFLLVIVIAGLSVLERLLRKKFVDFRLCIVGDPQSQPTADISSQQVSPTFGNSARVFWTWWKRVFLWCLVYWALGALIAAFSTAGMPAEDTFALGEHLGYGVPLVVLAVSFIELRRVLQMDTGKLRLRLVSPLKVEEIRGEHSVQSPQTGPGKPEE